MNRDKINDVYYGRAGTSDQQQRARARIHWMCSHARGTDVLDVGCSQGITSILLGREGLKVVGIDHELEAIEEAAKELSQEDSSVQERVRFEYTEGSDLPFPDGSFDTVILGEILEHLVLPERILAEARRVLRPDGVVVISTPYGMLEYHDHKESIYLDRLMQLLREQFVVETVDLVNLYLMAVARVEGQAPADLDERLLSVAERRVRDLDAELKRVREELFEMRAQRERLRESAQSWKETAEKHLATIRKERAESQQGLAELQRKLVFHQNHRSWHFARALREGTRSPKAFLKLPITLTRALRKPKPSRPAGS